MNEDIKVLRHNLLLNGILFHSMINFQTFLLIPFSHFFYFFLMLKSEINLLRWKVEISIFLKQYI